MRKRSGLSPDQYPAHDVGLFPYIVRLTRTGDPESESSATE